MLKRRIVGTAGHIDHGKTALVRALTGVDCDRLPEEKRRGITIDLGFASILTERLQIGFIDVPGHERFVKNMLAGVGGIDAALLVVAADESIKPQTREHFAICRMLRIPTGVVAITKKDLVDPDILGIVRLEVDELVRGSFLEGKPVVPVSNVSGEGIETLKEALDSVLGETPDRESSSRVFRLPIDRVFTMRGFGCVVTGTMVSGSLALDDDVELLPLGRRTRARHIQVHGSARESAVAGERTSVNLPDVAVEQIKRGEQLVTPGLLRPSRMLTVELELLSDAEPLADQTRVRFHHHSSELLGMVRILSAGLREIAPGASAAAQIRLESPVVALAGDRFVLRRYSPQLTIGGGVILDAHLGRLRRGAAQEVVEILARGSFEERLALLTRLVGLRGVTVNDLASRTGVLPAEISPATAALTDVFEIGSGTERRWIHRQHLETLRRQTTELLSEHFRSKPMSLGLPKSEFIQKLLPRDADPALASFLFEDLSREKVLTLEGDLIQKPGRSRELGGTEGELVRAIEERFLQAALQPPPVSQLIQTTSQKPKVVEGVVGYLVKTGVLVRLSEGLYVHRQALADARARVAAHRGASQEVGWFKDLFGLSRKVVIPLLEYLDRVGATRRVGDRREIL